MKGVLKLLIAALWLAYSCAALAADPQWVLLDDDPMVSKYYYDKTSVKKGTEGTVTVWTRAVYSEDGKADALETMGNPPAYKDLAHTFFMHTINCKDDKSRLEKVVHYDIKGEKIREFNLTGKTEWEEIGAATRMDLLEEAVCK